MPSVFPFRALRPTPEVASRVAAVPYDVVTTEEARELAAGNPLSFLHVSRPELDLPHETNPYADVVYEAAQRNFAQLVASAPLVYEERAQPLSLPAADGRPRADRRRRLLFGRRVRPRPDPEAREDAEGQGRRPHAAHRRSARPDRSRVPHVSGRAGHQRRGRRGVDRYAAVRLHGRRWRAAHDLACPGRRWPTAGARCLRTCRCSTSPTATIAPPARRGRGSALATPGVPAEADTFLAVAFPHDQMQVLPYNRTVKDLQGKAPGRVPRSAASRAIPSRLGRRRRSARARSSMFLAGHWYTVRLNPAGAGRLTQRRARRVAAARSDPGAAAGDRRRARGQAHRLSGWRPRHLRPRTRRRQRRGGGGLLDVSGRRRRLDDDLATPARSCRPSRRGSSRSCATGS